MSNMSSEKKGARMALTSAPDEGASPKIQYMVMMRKKKIVKLINEVNAHKLIGQVCPPLHVVDDQWRFVFGRSLAYEEYQRYSAGRKLLQMAIFDRDFEGEYYWIPYDNPPAGYTSPALRLQTLQ
jgi:hypothetical protein